MGQNQLPSGISSSLIFKHSIWNDLIQLSQSKRLPPFLHTEQNSLFGFFTFFVYLPNNFGFSFAESLVWLIDSSLSVLSW